MAQQGATSCSYSSLFHLNTKRYPLFKYNKSILIVIWLAVASQLIQTNLDTILSSWPQAGPLSTLSKDATNANNILLLPRATSQHKQRQDSDSLIERIVRLARVPFGPSKLSFGILFAEAGKKKKKEKSEVVVISVQNPPAKGHGMYPIFIPSCGGHGHGHGHGHGYGRRKRR